MIQTDSKLLAEESSQPTRPKVSGSITIFTMRGFTGSRSQNLHDWPFE